MRRTWRLERQVENPPEQDRRVRRQTDNLGKILEEEEKVGLSDPSTYQKYYTKVCEIKDQVKRFIEVERKKGNIVIGLGASTKGNRRAKAPPRTRPSRLD